MFNIVHNNHVILGPMPWRKIFFENTLHDDLEIHHSLPTTCSAPYVVDETTSILPVEFEPNPIYNPKTQHLNGPFWNIQSTKCVGYYAPQNLPVDFVRGKLIEHLAEVRWKFETKGITVDIQGNSLPITTRRIERDVYAQALTLGSDGATWKFGNIWLVLSSAELNTIATAIMTHVHNSFRLECLKIDELNLATTLNDLDKITFIEFD